MTLSGYFMSNSVIALAVLRTVENDLKHQNMGLWSARHRAYDRDQWRDIAETAMLLQGHATR